MTTVPLDEASRCPECKQPGKKEYTVPIMGGARHSFKCFNEVCPWFNTAWLVETDGNGEVQVNEEAYKRAHSTRLEAKGDPLFEQYFNQVHAALGAQLEAETNRE
jgi:hypothetical protein